MPFCGIYVLSEMHPLQRLSNGLAGSRCEQRVGDTAIIIAPICAPMTLQVGKSAYSRVLDLTSKATSQMDISYSAESGSFGIAQRYFA